MSVSGKIRKNFLRLPQRDEKMQLHTRAQTQKSNGLLRKTSNARQEQRCPFTIGREMQNFIPS